MSSVKLPPAPSTFKAVGIIEWARFALSPPKFFRTRRFTGRRAQGIRYENSVQDMLSARFPVEYVPSPWLQFLNESGMHYCQPDGLLIDVAAGIILIIEVKYQHTTDAWWQMRRLYEPVLSRIFPESLWTFKTLEIVKWYDPLVNWPEDIRMIADVHDALGISPTQTGIHIWKP